jgi:hypothetical protein
LERAGLYRGRRRKRVHVSRARYIASDIDREFAQAHTCLEEALTWAAAEGIAATGTVGDPNAALRAIEDELRLNAADEVIISTLAPVTSNWLEPASSSACATSSRYR